MIKSKSFPIIPILIIGLLGSSIQTDISLPSFPEIKTALNTTESHLHHILSYNFAGIFFAALLYGPISDAWGRKKVMQFSATCFMVASCLCAVSNSINQLAFWRFIQGVGASGLLVLGFTMVSDVFDKTKSEKISILNAAANIFSGLAPIVGSILISKYSWRASFIAVALVSIVIWVVLLSYLPETHDNQKKLKLGSVLSQYAKIFTEKEFFNFALITCTCFAAYMVFLSCTAFYYLESGHLSGLAYSFHNAIIIGLYGISSAVISKLKAKCNSKAIIGFGFVFLLLSNLCILKVSSLSQAHPSMLTLCMCLFSVGSACVINLGFSNAMNVFYNSFGSCAAIIIAFRLLFSVIGIYVVTTLFDGSLHFSALAMLTLSLISLGAFLYLRVTGGILD